MISTHALSVSIGKSAVLRDITLEIQPGELCAIVGPNGAGKSTLLRALCGLVSRTSGVCKIAGQDIADIPIAKRAHHIAWLPQTRPVAWNLKVEDLAALGRFDGRAINFANAASSDREAIVSALAQAGALAFMGRDVETLSGGEGARVHLARVLASRATILLLDEPAAALDLRHQLELMETLKAEAARGRTILYSAHDLNLVRRSGGRTMVLQEGRLVADGPAAQVPDANTLKAVFGVSPDSLGYFDRV
jgi:iron complex transport system ATP-binding protein